MKKDYTYIWNRTAENFEQVLCSISELVKKQYELVFPAGSIESVCTENNFPCYKFANNLERECYMRAKINKITLEFLVRNKKDDQSEKEAVVIQIRNNGERIYCRPEKPKGTLYVN